MQQILSANPKYDGRPWKNNYEWPKRVTNKKL